MGAFGTEELKGQDLEILVRSLKVYSGDSDKVVVYDIIFNEVYNRTYKTVYKIIRKSGINENIHEDISQQVYMKVHKRITELKDDKSFIKWLKVITKNTVSDHIRDNIRKKEICSTVQEDAFIDMQDYNNTPEKAFLVIFLRSEMARLNRKNHDRCLIGYLCLKHGVDNVFNKNLLEGKLKKKYSYREICREYTNFKKDLKKSIN